MAALDRDEMIALVLERIGIKAATVAARAEDSTAAGVVLDSVHDRLRKEIGLTFATSAVPEWAQIPLADIVGEECAPPFGIGGERYQVLLRRSAQGRTDLDRQMAKIKPPLRVRPRFC